jgi:hypothetical protein
MEREEGRRCSPRGRCGPELGNLNGKTPLHEAVRLGIVEIEGMLLKAGASLEARDVSGNTPLMEAVNAGLGAAAERLLENGAAPNVRDNHGETPLYAAVRLEKRDIANALLTRGAYVHAKNSRGDTPLRLALRSGSAQTETLLTKDRLDEPDDEGSTPLHLAVSSADCRLRRFGSSSPMVLSCRSLMPKEGPRSTLPFKQTPGHREAVLVEAGANPYIFTGAEENRGHGGLTAG